MLHAHRVAAISSWDFRRPHFPRRVLLDLARPSASRWHRVPKAVGLVTLVVAIVTCKPTSASTFAIGLTVFALSSVASVQLRRLGRRCRSTRSMLLTALGLIAACVGTHLGTAVFLGSIPAIWMASILVGPSLLLLWVPPSNARPPNARRWRHLHATG